MKFLSDCSELQSPLLLDEANCKFYEWKQTALLSLP